ncbi:AT-rich interactive domain-containing protein 4 isoform X1 [Physcomitrium patens]|uniref:ARID domain-containing protein n=1 Tax=Physcomitrium patens TaxID=3218 RepID=A0A2K1JBG3_PHYPA|nr:AT-rich interactive domain-containing protein 4-like isoform X2 [Physcomitrium patens]PNR38886.1 hypothetical protein PHYPA_019164 [Physcomitrium patens]|eukprot:XP_024396265.1 AT-rich interactive domain-containing protein 4-like isoform X2 [Physcomitrella patens]
MSRATTAGLSRSGKVKTVRTLLAVICGKRSKNNLSGHEVENDRKIERHANGYTLHESRSNSGQLQHQFADLETSGYLEVHIIDDPTKEELGWKLEKLHPDFLLLHGECSCSKDDIGGLVLRDGSQLSADALASLYGAKVPNLIYLETSGAKLGDALRSQGVPHVIYWKGAPTLTLASHFRQALLAALRSSATEAKDAFQIANASFQIHCGQTKTASVNGHEKASNVLPVLLAPADPKASDEDSSTSADEEDEKQTIPADSAPVQIYDDDINIRLLVCSEASRPTPAWFAALETGLSALLTIEAKGVRLLHRASAPAPPQAASSLHRGVVTMRCDICTTTFARIALLVSGAAQTCFDDQLLENSVRKELLERCVKIRLVEDSESQKPRLNHNLRRSVSIASGSSVVELKIRAPTWVGQVLRQLASEPSYRSLVALGIAGVEGAPVNAFLKEDSAHLVSLKRSRDCPSIKEIPSSSSVPSWLTPPPASRKRMRVISSHSTDSLKEHDRRSSRANADAASSSKHGSITLLAAMKPVPHSNRRRFMPFANAVMAAQHAGWTMKLDQTTRVERRRQRRPHTGRPRTATTQGSGGLVNPHLSITPAMVKPHGCSRPPMEECTEDEFLQDLVNFLESRGHNRLVPPAGLEAFPEVVLNGKRLDLYNLYKEVVSRGGFHVGNGINWKGQVFSKMHNHTSVNKMTGVGNTLKKHYETYLLEYELAHDDVDGECCILCHSGSEGDWVNCGSCGEWAHFGCDHRLGLGAFKDYAKTDGLEYICPCCSEGKPNSRRSKKFLEVKSSQEIQSPPSDHPPTKQRRS